MKFLNKIDGADKLITDANNRLVKDTDISNWNNKSDKGHKHTKSEITDFPTSLPANGGNADTVGGKKPSDFANMIHSHDASDIHSGVINSTVLPETFRNLTDGNSNLPYKFDLIIYGDSDKYYPVHIATGNQNLLRTIKIWRNYSEQAPSDWYSATHKGSLNLEWKGNFGSWGGAVYSQWIYENTSQYTTLLAGTEIVDNCYGVAFFLRGGGTTGAIYHIASDQPLTWGKHQYLTYTEPTPFYNQDLTFNNSNDAYKRYAPPPKTSVDTAQLQSITVMRGKDLVPNISIGKSKPTDGSLIWYEEI